MTKKHPVYFNSPSKIWSYTFSVPKREDECLQVGFLPERISKSNYKEIDL